MILDRHFRIQRLLLFLAVIEDYGLNWGPNYLCLRLDIFSSRKMINCLPREVLLGIILYIQPDTLSSNEPWTESNHDFVKYSGNQKYHPAIKVTAKKLKNRQILIPSLLNIMHVCKAFRRTAKLHPIFTKFQFYKMCPLPKHAENLQEIIRFSTGFKLLAENLGDRLNIFRLDFRPSSDGHIILVEELLFILDKVSNLEELILDVCWLVLNDSRVIKKICEFRGLKKLHLKGSLDGQVLRGFTNTEFRSISLAFSCLTHLFIDNVSMSGYRWKPFRQLLKRNPGIVCLKIGHMEGGIDFDDIGVVCPNLQVLVIHFSDGHHSQLLDLKCSGSLASIPQLKEIYFDICRGINPNVVQKIADIVGSRLGFAFLDKYTLGTPIRLS